MNKKTGTTVLRIILAISVSLNIYFFLHIDNREALNGIITFVRSWGQTEDTVAVVIPSPEELEEMEEDIIRLTNEYRASLGLNELTQDTQLTYVARIRAIEIETTWSHDRADGSIFADILAAMKYPSPRVGENLGRYQKTTAEVMDMWKESSGHNANLIGEFNKIGVGVHVSEDGYLHFVQIFAQ